MCDEQIQGDLGSKQAKAGQLFLNPEKRQNSDISYFHKKSRKETLNYSNNKSILQTIKKSNISFVALSNRAGLCNRSDAAY